MSYKTLSQQIKNCEKSIKNIYESLQSLLQEIEETYPMLPNEIKKEQTPKIRFIYPEDCTKNVLEKLLYKQVRVPAKVSGLTQKHEHYHANRIRGKPQNV